MTERNLEEMSKEELIRELQKLQTAGHRLAAQAGEADRERILHDLHVHQVELEMQNRELREAQARLEESRDRYTDLYDFAPVGYCTLDPEGRIQEINLTGAALLGVTRDRLLGNSLSAVVRLGDVTAFHSHLRQCATRKARVESEIELASTKPGARVVRMISDPVLDRSGTATAYRTSLVDISEIKALETRLQLLAGAGEQLAASLESTAVIETAARIAVPALADLCIIDVRSPSGTVERKVVRFADPTKQANLARRMMQVPSRPGRQMPQVQVIASGEPMLLSGPPAVGSEPAVDDRDDDSMRAANIRSLMIVPLSASRVTFGAVTLASSEPGRRYTQLDLQTAQALATRVAMALDSARLYAESQRSNQALQISEARASGIVSVSADAIICIDEDQRITLFNEGAEKLFGHTSAEAIGAPLERLLPERFRAAHRQDVETFATTGHEIARKMGDRRAAIVGLRKNGEEFPADASISKLELGGARLLTVALRDITEQKRTERDQQFLATVGKELSSLDHDDLLTQVSQLAVRELADLSVLYLVGEDGEVRRSRAAARDPSKAWLREPPSNLPIDRRSPHPLWQILEIRRPIVLDPTPDVLASFAQSDEDRRALDEAGPGLIIGVPLLVGDQCTGALFLASAQPRAYGSRDVDLAEEFGRRAAVLLENARLHRTAQRAIRARDQVLGVIAHDLRAPLGSILLQAKLLGRLAEPGSRSARPIEAIELSGRHMKRLIEDLLDVARLDAGSFSIERAPVAMTEVVSQFVETQRPVFSSTSIELRTDLAPDLGEVLADRDRLLQILENLAGNAVKFTPPGGYVTIGAASKETEILCWIADTGQGIAETNLPHVFDRFWQAQKTERRGAGLGLPIVKAIVEAHGGRVWVESRIGHGTTFFFTLPVVRPGGGMKPEVRSASDVDRS